MMLREKSADTIELSVNLSQIKKLYIALFRQLHRVRADFDDLDEDDMLLTLQTYLQRQAAKAGVDGTIHEEWERFLGMSDGPSYERRTGDSAGTGAADNPEDP